MYNVKIICLISNSTLSYTSACWVFFCFDIVQSFNNVPPKKVFCSQNKGKTKKPRKTITVNKMKKSPYIFVEPEASSRSVTKILNNFVPLKAELTFLA